MNVFCTKCAIMKLRLIKLAKISMNIKQATLLTPDAYGGYLEVILTTVYLFLIAITVLYATSYILLRVELHPVLIVGKRLENTATFISRYIMKLNRTIVWLNFFIRPSSDGTYYGMVMSVRPSVRVSVRPSQFSALFSYMLWHIDLKFCVSLYFYARKIKFECHQFPSLFTGSYAPFYLQTLTNMQFSALFSYMLCHIEFKFCIWLCFNVPQNKFECRHFVQFLLELCPFWNLEYLKYTVFRTFLLHALTYWAEILHMTLFYSTTDQVRVSSIF